jgi:transposase-like protein
MQEEVQLSACKQMDLLKMFVAGATAEMVGVHRNTANSFFMRFRSLIAGKLPGYELSGEAEADESYFGGLAKASESVEHLGKWLYSACSSGAGRFSLPLFPTQGRRLCWRSSRKKWHPTALFTRTLLRPTMLSR